MPERALASSSILPVFHGTGRLASPPICRWLCPVDGRHCSVCSGSRHLDPAARQYRARHRVGGCAKEYHVGESPWTFLKESFRVLRRGRRTALLHLGSPTLAVQEPRSVGFSSAHRRSGACIPLVISSTGDLARVGRAANMQGRAVQDCGPEASKAGVFPVAETNRGVLSDWIERSELALKRKKSPAQKPGSTSCRCFNGGAQACP